MTKKLQSERESLLSEIAKNIKEFGHHVHMVQPGPLPRFAYTIGLRDHARFELVLAGAARYSVSEALIVVNAIASRLKMQPRDRCFEMGALGTFDLRLATDEWSRLVALGAADYYDADQVVLQQIVPSGTWRTLDVPDMGSPIDSVVNSPWRWLKHDWDYSVPAKSMVAVDTAVLCGAYAMECVRWETDYWEAFSKSVELIDRADVRLVPVGTLIGLDPTTSEILDLSVGKGLWRTAAGLVWQPWCR